MKKECDVLFIHSTKNPQVNPIGNTIYGIMPMGIIAILNKISIDDNNSVIGVNIAIEKYLNKNFSISSFLTNIKYKILLIDLHWYEHSYGSIYIAKQSKKIFPHIPVILGGYTSTIFAEEILKEHDEIDYIITGDSDYPLPLLINRLLNKEKIEFKSIPNLYYKKGKQIMFSLEKWKQSTLDKLNFTSTDVFINSNYIPYLTTTGVINVKPSYWLCIARGCLFNCSYCCGANKNMGVLFNGRCNVLLRSPNLVAKDIKVLTKKGIEHICISHDFEMFGEQYYKNIFDEIKRLQIKPGLYLECFQLPSIKFLKAIMNTFDKKMFCLLSLLLAVMKIYEKRMESFLAIQILLKHYILLKTID